VEGKVDVVVKQSISKEKERLSAYCPKPPSIKLGRNSILTGKSRKLMKKLNERKNYKVPA
jgi:hypothetical protein